MSSLSLTFRQAIVVLLSLLTATSSVVEAQVANREFILAPDTYVLRNHPDGRYAREDTGLYGLIMSGFAGKTRILYDFDHPDARVILDVREDKLVIRGTAVARELIDGEWQVTDLWKIRFAYRRDVETIDNGGMHDYMIYGSGRNTGWFENVATGIQYDVDEKANGSGLTFRLGDGDGTGIRMDGHLDSIASNPLIDTDPDVPIAGAGWIWESMMDEPDDHPSDWLFLVGSLTGGRVNRPDYLDEPDIPDPPDVPDDAGFDDF